MTQINITRFFNEAAPMDYSASCAEIGQNAGTDTWNAAKEDAPYWNMLDDDDKRDAFRFWVKSSGAWDDDEIAAWSDVELNALFVQWVSGDIREGFEWDCEDIWANYQELAERGTVSSNIWKDDDGEIFFSLEG
jgi:hypothetical protein